MAISMYDKMALIFNQIADLRNHFGEQASVLIKIFDELKIKETNKILDAACGTGQVGLRLYNSGFKNIFFTDGSPAMINIANSSLSTGLKAGMYTWDNLDNYFNENNSFDLIYMFGHSLPHAAFNKLPKIFKNIYSGLSENGKFLFDLRNWVPNEKGELRQPNRPENVERILGLVTLNGKNFDLYDKVYYDDRTQYVEYILKTETKNTVYDTFQLSYSIYRIEDIIQIFTGAGFDEFKLTHLSQIDWAYDAFVIEK